MKEWNGQGHGSWRWDMANRCGMSERRECDGDEEKREGGGRERHPAAREGSNNERGERGGRVEAKVKNQNAIITRSTRCT